jgi:bacillithiol biosynthesis cysteine-adding enzyme BshC
VNQQTVCRLDEIIFRVKNLSFSEIPHQSKLFLAYQRNPRKLTKYYPQAVNSLTEIADKIPSVTANYVIDRNALCEILRQSNQTLGAGKKTLENIELLGKQNCVAVVTGQQAGLFGGPLYTIYKILSAIRLTEMLRNQGVRAVPIFWIAEEDHDFDEVKKAFVLTEKPASGANATETQLQKIEYVPQNTVESLPVGAVRFDNNVEKTIDELFKKAGYTEFSAELKDLLHDCYKFGESFSSALARFFLKIFDRYGLIVILSLDRQLKKLVAPIFREAIEKSGLIRERLLQRNSDLKAEGFHAQVSVEEDFFPFFWFDEQEKRRALKKNKHGKIQVKGMQRDFTLDELLEIAEKMPEKLSPNALMRPVVQDYLLPTAVYFGGAAEIAYFAQNSVIYDLLKRPATTILHRQSFTIVEPRHRRTMKKYDLELKDFFSGFENLTAQVVERFLNPQTATLINEVEEKIKAELGRLDDNFSAISTDLVESLANRRRKILFHIEKLRKIFHHKQTAADESIHRQLKSAFAALLPHGNLQERTLNVIPFLNRYGAHFLNWLYNSIDLKEQDHRILYL